MLFFDKKPAGERPWTERLWVYDLRTNMHFTLKQNRLRREHLDDFVNAYAPGKPRDSRTESERFRSFAYDEIVARDKANLDIAWLRDDSLDDERSSAETARSARSAAASIASRSTSGIPTATQSRPGVERVPSIRHGHHPREHLHGAIASTPET